MRKSLFPLLLLLIRFSLPLSAQLHVWQSGVLMHSEASLKTDSITFIAPDYPRFAFLRLSDTQISVTPSDTLADYIWVATSDADYRSYGYSSYVEAWQANVDVAIRYNFLETDMLSRGKNVIDLTNTFTPDHYVLAVAAWDGTKASSPFAFYEFTLTDSQQQNTASALPASAFSFNGSSSLMLLWSNGIPADTLLTAATDSITFSSLPEPLSFDISFSELTSVSVAVDIIPSQDSVWYFADYILRADADRYADTTLARLWIQQCIQYLPYNFPGQTFAEAYLYQGNKHLVFNEGLMGDTDYYFVCFSVNPQTGAVESAVTKQLFRTPFTPSAPDLTFDISYNPETYIVTITPSDLASTYYWGFFSPDEVRAAGSAEAAWKEAVAQYGSKYVEHGVQTFSARWQAMGEGLHSLVVGGWNGQQTTELLVYPINVTKEMLPF
ncbi:MAG: hypothetical protein IJ776_05750 [Paludibacteraceae bacterium]|nr:hypothetical protein [Paludibacteraceae bacterium]